MQVLHPVISILLRPGQNERESAPGCLGYTGDDAGRVGGCEGGGGDDEKSSLQLTC